MADPVAPSELPTGTTGTIPVRVAAKGALDVLDSTGKVVSNLPAAKGLTVTPVAIAVVIGDVLMERATGDTRVVRWVATDGLTWSSAQSTRPQFSTDGWMKVGTAAMS
jgi:hypothetical protein